MTTELIHNATAQAPTRNPVRLIWVAPLAMLTATAANLGLYAVAGRLFPSVGAWSGAGPGQIVGATIVYLLLGALIFAAVRRFSTHPRRHYVLVATLGLLFSLALPVGAGFGGGAPGAPPAGVVTVLTLSLLHVVSYAISVPLFTRLALR